MTFPIVCGFVLGTILERFFRVFVLVPACAIVMAAVAVRSAYLGHGPLYATLDYAVLAASLQTGYASALLLAAIQGAWQRLWARSHRDLSG
jgi:hypothetical protein